MNLFITLLENVNKSRTSANNVSESIPKMTTFGNSAKLNACQKVSKSFQA
jgi:hypothetical protein